MSLFANAPIVGDGAGVIAKNNRKDGKRKREIV